MKYEELLSKTLWEVLEEYSMIYNYECGFSYGIVPNDILPEIIEKYEISEYPEAFAIEPVMDIDLIADTDDELLDNERISRIMKNLGIKTKKPLSLNITKQHKYHTGNEEP